MVRFRFINSSKESHNIIDKEKPLVSIIITSYNYGRYLADAIESAQRQTFPNIEIIVVDDGSTDNTRDVAERYPVRYIFQKNRGAAAAKNRGIKCSHGEFFRYLDADDKLAPEYVRKTMEQMMKEPKIGFVCTGSKVWNEETRIARAQPEADKCHLSCRSERKLFNLCWR